MRKSLCFICILFSGILPLAAQSDSGGDTPREAGRSAWFACISIPDGLENPVKVMGGKEITELELPRYMASDPVKIPDDGIIRIVREAPDPENPGKTKYLVLAEAKIPENVREALIILSPLAEARGRSHFPGQGSGSGGLQRRRPAFHQPERHTISGVRFGDTKVAVAPRQANIYKSPILAEPTNMPDHV